MTAGPLSAAVPRTLEPPTPAVGLGVPLDSSMREFSSRIDNEIEGLLETEVDDGWMRGAIRCQFGWVDAEFAPLSPERRMFTGKRLRPLLALLSFQSALVVRQPSAAGLAGPDLDDVVTFAAAVELVHNFSLIHDDIEDGDRLRRGRPTLWTVCGEAHALNVGDCVHALAYGCLGRLQARGVEQSLVGALVYALAKATVDMTVGQRRDMAYESDLRIDNDMYSSMVAGKTAALMACATYGGALLALGDRGRAAHQRTAGYAEFGRQLGHCFQIRDDILGIWGVSAQTGKPAAGDIRRRKKSLPVVFALGQAGSEERERLRYLYALPTELTSDQEREVRALLDGCAAEDLSQRQAEHHADLALGALSGVAAGTQGVETNGFFTALRALTASLTARER